MSKKLVIFARDIFQIILYKMLNHLFATAPLSILVFFTSSCLVAGQVERDGSCPDIQYMSSVDLPTLQGSWYLHSRYRGLDNENARCYKADFTPGSDNVHTITNFRISNTDDCVKVNTETHTSLSDGYFMVSNFERGAIRLIYDILTYCNDYIIIYVCHDLPLSKHNDSPRTKSGKDVKTCVCLVTNIYLDLLGLRHKPLIAAQVLTLSKSTLIWRTQSSISDALQLI
ncbi:uncharacterized protein [Eurosta solidaginis]|uniref:uncharacterized protein isoform X2 n=1 Tax=Eurosta solidaginis TaxID=178769 RepID=UPI003530D532